MEANKRKERLFALFEHCLRSGGRFFSNPKGEADVAPDCVGKA